MSYSFGREYEEADQLPGQPIAIKPAVPAPGVYPLEALSPKLEAAARAIADKVQVAPAIAAQAVLAAASLATQGFIDICLPTGEVVPSSLFIVSIAESGDRKSSTDKLALAGVRRKEAEMRQTFRSDTTHFQVEQLAYKAARKKAESVSKDRKEIARALEDCGVEPIPPAQPVLLVDEPTMPSLLRLFAEAMPSLGLFSDEGATLLGGHAMNDENRAQTGGVLSKLWDGATIKRVRASEAVSYLPGRRLALHIMVQPRIARRLFGDQDLKSQGLLSRILVAEPLTLKGQRPWRDPDVSSQHAIEAYDARMDGLLGKMMPMDIETRELKPKVIPFSAEARTLWIQWHDAVEIELKPGGIFDDITGFAAKLPEHAARLAAVMAFFENSKVEEISGQALARGIKLAKHYANEALRVVGMGSADEDSENAEALISWIRSKGLAVVGKRWLSRHAIPKHLRAAVKLKRAVDVLVEHGHLHEISGGGTMSIDGKDEFYKQAYTVIADDEAGK